MPSRTTRNWPSRCAEPADSAPPTRLSDYLRIDNLRRVALMQRNCMSDLVRLGPFKSISEKFDVDKWCRTWDTYARSTLASNPIRRMVRTS